MRNLLMLAGVAGGLLLAVLTTSASAAQDRRGPDSCRADDVVCRLDRIERRMDRVMEALERLERRGGGAGGGRSVEMQTSAACGASNCVDEAVQLCRTAGFSRGVPTEVRSATFSGRLLRATCMD